MPDTPEAPGLPQPMGDTPGGGPSGVPAPTPTPSTPAPPSGDQTPVTPPTGQPMTPQGVPAVGQLALGRAHMGVALLHMDQAVRTLPAGSEDHHLAMELYMKGIKHFKKQEPIEPGPANLGRPSMPGMPPGGGPPGMGGGPGGPQMGAPQLPRGPIPAPTGGM